jgi:hypothetical protein
MNSTKVDRPDDAGKKPYRTPQLVCYGDVVVVTRGVGTWNAASGGLRRRKSGQPAGG